MNSSIKVHKIGEKVRQYRLKAGMSQLDLEMAIETSAGSISRIENGGVNPTKETLLKITEVLKLSPIEKAELFDFEIFKPENILQALNWLANSQNIAELQQRACDILYRLHNNYNGGGIFKVSEDRSSIIPTYLSNMPGIEKLPNYLKKHISEFKIPLENNEENLLVKNIKTLEPYQSTDLSDFAVGGAPRQIARGAGSILKFNVGISFPLIVDKDIYGAILYTKTIEESFDEYEENLLNLLTTYISTSISNLTNKI